MPVEDPIEAFFSVPEAYSPRVSPDNEWVVCCWSNTGRFELHVYHLETGERRQLTSGHIPMNPNGRREPEHARHYWDRGSDSIVFQGPETERGSVVYRVSLDGTIEELFAVDGSIYLWAVNPKTGRVYYRVEDEILRWYNPATGEVGDFAEFPGLPLEYFATCTVSPDGEWIAYTSLPPEADWDGDTSSLTELQYAAGLATYIARADGTEPQHVDPAKSGKRTTPVQWHPDSNRLLITSDDAHHRDARKCGIYDRETETVEWIADEGAVAFFDGGECILLGAMPQNAIKITDLQGNVRSIDCEGKFYMTKGSDAVVDDSGCVFIRRSVNRHFEAFRHNLTTGKTTVLFGAEYENRPLSPQAIVSPTEVTYELPDGSEADGQLYRPPESGSTATPALTKIYGGRYWSRRFRPDVQALAHLGYTVFLPNCPSDAFTQETHEVFAAAGRWLAKQDGIDENRVGVYGRSRGGYNVIMQAVNYPEVWDVFVADAPKVDVEKEPSPAMWHQLGSPTENTQVYRELSPLEHLKGEIGRSILLIHGEEDGTVDIEHSRLFGPKLEDQGWTDGNEFEFHALPGMGHSPRSKEKWIESWHIIVDFLDRRF